MAARSLSDRDWSIAARPSSRPHCDLTRRAFRARVQEVSGSVAPQKPRRFCHWVPLLVADVAIGVWLSRWSPRHAAELDDPALLAAVAGDRARRFDPAGLDSVDRRAAGRCHRKAAAALVPPLARRAAAAVREAL